ncbi:YoaP domain-containing protein [Virgibacillus tibetensis]|uniref:YoaP domain-containing protein n=1 Tax=Virgibacillus tibetensis TaxID=3042313 RepID=UPI002E1861F4
MVEIIDVSSENVNKYGFFCMRSKSKSDGYQNKLRWLKERFKEGLKIKIIQENRRQRGFIEYIPGKHTWRAINAKEYMVIHCFWIVGKNKGKGFGVSLLNECIKDAKNLNLAGVVLVTSNKGWLPDKLFFEKKGFTLVDQIGEFELMAQLFKDGTTPSFYDWQKTAKEFSNGITVFKSDQCPFIQDAVINLEVAADELDIKVNIVELDNYEMAQQKSPTPFGVFTVIYNGEIITYHPETKNKFVKLLEKQSLKLNS